MLRAELESLLDPRAWPAPQPREVTLIETHISWVLLGGEHVYKLKKPVLFGFLDFSTEPLRRAACEAELRLNRRLAEDVYLDVVDVWREPDGTLRLGGARGVEVVERAVHMRRVPDTDRADVRLREGRLGEAELARIAERIARFHEAARCDAETSALGGVERIARNVRENFAEEAPFVAELLQPDEEAALVDAQEGFLAQSGALFEARVAGQHVRECHGDLRLEHVYVSDDAVRVIDCVEFDARFRHSDTCADVAFLAMDLARQGRPELAERFLAQYATESGDHDLYQLVDFYASYRAFVRGKIASLRLSDAHLAGAARDAVVHDARTFLVLALAESRPPLTPPRVVAVGGLIGAGKSTAAAALARAMGAPVVEADRVRKQLVGVQPTTHLYESAWKGAYDPAFTETVYAELMRRAAVVLATGRSVILDASFRSPRFRAAARSVAQAARAPFLFVECTCDDATTRARLREREARTGVSDGRTAILDDFRASWEPVTELAPREHTVIDTAHGGLEALLREV